MFGIIRNYVNNFMNFINKQIHFAQQGHFHKEKQIKNLTYILILNCFLS